MTYCGVQLLAGLAMLLGNRGGTTVAVVAYDNLDPVVIRLLQAKRSQVPIVPSGREVALDQFGASGF